MPAQVQVGTTAQYGEKELGAFTAQAVEAVKGISEGNIEKIKNSITNTGESATMMAESAVTKTLDIIPGLGGIGAAWISKEVLSETIVLKCYLKVLVEENLHSHLK